jgi:hypothetical protein
MNINILVLAAGQVGQDKSNDHYPVCLTEVDGKSVLEKIVENTRNLENAKYVFAISEIDIEKFHLDNAVKILAPDSLIVRIPESTKGSACTALLAACQLPLANELLILSANELIEIDFKKVVSHFRAQELNGGTIVFRSIHPRYSYVKINSEGFIMEAAQQNPISNQATVGAFWFSKTSDFIEASKNLIRKNASVHDSFFVAPTFNELILKHKKIGALEITSDKYRPLKTNKQLEKYEQGS